MKSVLQTFSMFRFSVFVMGMSPIEGENVATKAFAAPLGSVSRGLNFLCQLNNKCIWQKVGSTRTIILYEGWIIIHISQHFLFHIVWFVITSLLILTKNLFKKCILFSTKFTLPFSDTHRRCFKIFYLPAI